MNLKNISSESGCRVRLLLIAGFLLTAGYLSDYACGGWTHKSSWNQLQKNTAAQDVEKLLGTPKDKESTSQREVWYYQQTPVRQDGKVISRPKQGFVNFSKVSISPLTRQRLDEPGLFISTWSEPDWTAITEQEKQADIPEVDFSKPQLPAEFEQRRQEMMKEHEENVRQAEERQKQFEAEFERRHQETMERIQKQQQQMQQRMQDVNTPATQTPRPSFTPPTRPGGDRMQPSGPAAVQPAQPQASQPQGVFKVATLAGLVVGIILAIGIALAVFPPIMMLLVRWLAGYKVSWWMCCKAYLLAHLLGLIVTKGYDQIIKQTQLCGTPLFILSLAALLAALLIYAAVYRVAVRDEDDTPLGFPKAVILTLIIDALPLLILILLFK